ncbi:MAG: hypothetical protein MZW92_62250 [Comamonadaceae bacterium]|nr:hypothetical protein [Comamonadaceae bacterium]
MVGAGVLVDAAARPAPRRRASSSSALIVITIVATAGMTSTTYVQFIKGALAASSSRSSWSSSSSSAACPPSPTRAAGCPSASTGRWPRPKPDGSSGPRRPGLARSPPYAEVKGLRFVKLAPATAVRAGGRPSRTPRRDASTLHEIPVRGRAWPTARRSVNGAPASKDNQLRQVGNMEAIAGKTGPRPRPGASVPFKFLSAHRRSQDTGSELWKNASFDDNGGQGDGLLPGLRAPATRSCGPGQRSRSKGTATRPDRLPLAHAGPVPGHGRPAPHPHPLLHRPQPGRGPEIDHRGHRRHRLLLHPDPVHGPGRDDQRRSSTCSTTTCRPRCWPARSGRSSSR